MLDDCTWATKPPMHDWVGKMWTTRDFSDSYNASRADTGMSDAPTVNAPAQVERFTDLYLK